MPSLRQEPASRLLSACRRLRLSRQHRTDVIQIQETMGASERPDSTLSAMHTEARSR